MLVDAAINRLGHADVKAKWALVESLGLIHIYMGNSNMVAFKRTYRRYRSRNAENIAFKHDKASAVSTGVHQSLYQAARSAAVL